MTNKKEKQKDRRGLGRGLSALMADVQAPTTADTATAISADRTIKVPVENLHPNPDQPRRNFGKDELDDLTASIREKGVIQPLIVRAIPDRAGHYQIVAGERRWRASQKAQLHELPVLVREFSDTEVLEVAIIENIQRADLNAIEEAQGFRQLMDRFGHTQEKLAEALGKSRSHIANILRLLTLPDEVLDHVREGRLSAGHARALIGSDDAAALARQIIAKKMSVRQAEQLVKSGGAAKEKVQKKQATPEKDADTRALERDLGAALRMPVSIRHEVGGEKGVVELRYQSLDQLDELCRLLSSES